MDSERRNTVQVGIIGVGNMGSSHARCLLENKIPGAALAAVADLDPERLKAFPGVAGWEQPERMLADARLDAVLIATPHYQHVPLGIRALESGLHVLVEKPIAVHKADAERLLAAWKNPAQVFAAVFNQRTDPRYRWVRERIADGAFGPIRRINWIITDWFRTEAYYRNGSWRATWAGEGGGVLLNQCPHQLDLWQWMFGMPKRVRAFCRFGRFHDIEVEDDVTAYLEYESGTTGVFVTTTGEAPGTNRLEIAADNGRVVIEGKTLLFHRNHTSAAEFSAACPKPFDAPPVETRSVTFDGSGEQHPGILRNFVAAIHGTEPLLAPGSEGIHSVELANAMIYSTLTGQTVELPLDGAAYETRLRELARNSTFRKQPGSAGTASPADMSQSFKR